ncbi:beta-galactosidase-1-like protein 2 [Leptinotarsa decemlineata]|uniref:beta-galactosidase-1-like protein 2 n=1 Tax=Leptinotarsa decemlineata TaxID=7539 RepID=UPI003D30CE15
MENLSTLYEHYTSGGISRGLSVDQPYFTLNNKNISIYSGSMHYFRVPSEYWRDRLKKIRAAGLNAVETYVPWNLHEPQPGKYDFGEGGTDMQELLNIEKYLKTAQEEDLFVIVRPGPFICAEFEFGGLPSWLLREKNIKIRTSDEKFMKHVRRYFNVLLTLLATFQFTRGGPIISFQVENEYGSTEDSDADPPIIPDLKYIEELRQLMIANNITELLFTSDSPTGHASRGSLSSLFQTANFNSDPEKEFDKLKELQKNKPSMSTEYWAGWFNHWSEKHYIGNTVDFTITYERILKYPASVNLYMFHGGTSWGFLNGANMASVNQSDYQPDITSYDYDAPLTEYGDYTSKYFAVKLLLEKFNSIKTKLPEVPIVKKPDSYPSLNISEFLRYENIISQLPVQVESRNLISMENLPINNNTGQQFGYIIYRKRSVTINRFAVLKILGYVYDSVNVYVNNELITKNVVDLDSFGYWRKENGSINLGSDKVKENATIDIMVCNMGRNNFGSLDQFRQFKGLWQGILLDDQELLDWEIYPVEFKKSWISNLSGWTTFDASSTPLIGAGLYKAELLLKDLHDTFIDMSKWRKGLVIVNNFVLGRFWKIGPQQSLYIPAPFLKIGINEIIVFDEFSSGKNVSFSDEPIYLNNFVDDLFELS